MLSIDEYLAAKSEKRNTQWLAARIALQEAIGKSGSKLIKNQKGKPFLTEKGSHISITHSGNMAAAIYSATDSCGIDIEIFDPRILKIGHKFTTENERLLFSDTTTLGCLCLNWCAKESIFKYGSLHDVDFKTQIQLMGIDFESQTMQYCFTRVLPLQYLKVYYKVYKVINNEVFETPLLPDLEMQTHQRYILTWL